MRTALGLLLAVLMLVSHGGFSGAMPHVDHSHEHGHEHSEAGHHLPASDHSTAEADHPVVTQMAAADAAKSEEPASHPAPHGHAVLGMPETGAHFASVEYARTLPVPLPTAPLMGTSSAPLTQPPLA